MNNELLPCPFCGGEVGFHKDEECDGCHYIECQSCKGMFDLSTKADPENNAEALKDLNERIATVWNQRSQQSATVIVPRELLVRHLNEIGIYAWAENTDEQLRALLGGDHGCIE